ncbi:MAG: adenylate/guanylate cyclase domain-containing protein [Leptospiraceae bacterium]|nr:adenylate/guanylate cyclase domain-containing protein [Leptospiraceae bacterium]
MSRRHYVFFAVLYLIIPVSVNAFVVVASYTFLAPFLLTNEEFIKITQAGDSQDLISRIFSYMSFIIPTSIGYIYNMPLIIYMLKRSKESVSEKIKAIIINLPIVNATVSFAGWGLALIGTFINFAINSIQFSTMSMVKFSLFNILMANLCFVIIYYLIEFINKRSIRQMLPNQNLSEIQNTIKISIRFRFFVFFVTVSLTPSILLVNLIISILNDNHIEGYTVQTGFIFSGIVLIGSILTFFISNAFAKPIKILQAATKELQFGNFDVVVPVDSIDEVGFLGERFNEMSISIKEKEFIKDTFGKVVDPSVRDYLLKGNLALGGETKEVSVLFVDIRGFTTISEKLPPSEVVRWLNQYFEQMSRCITQEKGLINKFIGDAILAVFGAPIPLENHAKSALKAALEMRKQSQLLSQEFQNQGLPELNIGIGIHSGPALVGNIGSMSRLEYTVIGDTVNIASRIESHCKQVGKDLLITENTKLIAGDSFTFDFVSKIQVRGRQGEIGIYSL